MDSELQPRGREGATREPLVQQPTCLAGWRQKVIIFLSTEVPGIQEGPQ